MAKIRKLSHVMLERRCMDVKKLPWQRYFLVIIMSQHNEFFYLFYSKLNDLESERRPIITGLIS